MSQNYLKIISEKLDEFLQSDNLQSVSILPLMENDGISNVKSTISSSVTSFSSEIEDIEVNQDINKLIPELVNRLFDNFQSKEEEIKSKKLEFELMIDQNFIELYELLNKSIIQGEYTYKNFVGELSSIRTKIKKGLVQIGISNNFFYNALQNFKIATDEYSRFAREFVLKINNNQIFLFYSQLSRYELNTSTLIKDWFYITENNLNICCVDINFSVKPEKLNLLLNIYYQFNIGFLNSYINQSSSYNETVQLIFQKTSFLLFKIRMRILLEKVEIMENDPSSIQSFLLNLNDQKLDSLELNFNVFDDYCKHILKHYEINTYGSRERFNYEKDKDFINIRLNKLQFDKLEKLDFIKFHKFIKYYKDYAKKVTPINDYLTNFDELLNKINNDSLNKYDSYALDVFFQYLQNNILSLKIEQFSFSQFSELKEELLNIESSQFNTRLVHNYFPFYKFLYSYAIKYLEHYLNLTYKGAYVDLDEVKNNIAFIESKLNTAISYFDWCNERDFSHIQLPYEASTVSYTYAKPNNEKINVFLFSSLFLPTNYEKIGDNLLLYKNSIVRLKNKLDDFSDMESIRNEIKSYSNKSIEILAIFTAVVVFTLSSVQVLSSKEIDLISALSYLGVVGAILSIFTYLIFLITASSSVFHKRKIFFILPSIISASIFIASLIYLILMK